MALAGTLEGEVEIHSPADKFFNFLVTQLHHVQNITDHVHETKVHQGDWHSVGPDHVKHWTFTVDGKVETCREHIEEIDREKKSITFNNFDGHVGEKYKTLKSKLEAVERGINNGAVAKWTYQYEQLHEDVPPPQAYLDFVIKTTKDIDAHLLKA
ncbi:MLP-like protein 43 [Neltuma alba]|uniref:MLP-like protein 43 n=1 Tax=Neltuma alba TaxID=207710 RepID=UPI0010A44531|nr:MLP-like protein 43 [Prosopis alba]